MYDISIYIYYISYVRNDCSFSNHALYIRMCLAKWDDPVLNADNSTTSAALPRVRLRFCFDVLALHLTPPQQGVFFVVWFFGVIFCSIRGKSLTWRCTRPLGAEFTFRGSVGRDGHTWSHLTTSMVEFWVDFRRRSYGTRTKPQESHTISHELHTSNAHLSVSSGFLELTQFVDEP